MCESESFFGSILKVASQKKFVSYVCPQIWTVTSVIYKQQKGVWKFLISKHVLFESNISTITPHFFNPISRMFRTFPLKLNIADHILFSASGPETEGQI